MKNVVTLLATITLLTVPALASISEAPAENTAPVLEKSTLKSFIGFGGGNALLLEDGTLVLTIRGGVSLTENFRAGIWGSTVASDVKNWDAPGNSQYVEYNAAGIVSEFQLLTKNNFSLSIPVLIGCGYVNIQEEGIEDAQAKDGFFIAEGSLHFNYQVTPALQIALGGGYRLFLGIDYENLKNRDFNTPFAEIVFYWNEH